MGPIGRGETSVTTDQRPINIPEEQKPHLYSGGKLISRTDVLVRTRWPECEADTCQYCRS